MHLRCSLRQQFLQRTGSIHAKGEKYTYGFDKCLTVMSQELNILKEDERATLSILDAQRDQAAHYYIEISEDVLYVHAQSGVTLFDELLARTFNKRLADSLPSRVLPVSTRPPRDLALLLNSELSEVDRLLSAGRGKVRTLPPSCEPSWHSRRAQGKKKARGLPNPRLTPQLQNAESVRHGM